MLLASIAHAKLVYGDLEGTKTDMDSAWKILDPLDGVEGSVNAAYYGVAADYYKVRSLSVYPLLPYSLRVRLKQSMHHTIATHCYISPVSTQRKI